MILKSLIQLLKEYPDYKLDSDGTLILSSLKSTGQHSILSVKPDYFQYLGKEIGFDNPVHFDYRLFEPQEIQKLPPNTYDEEGSLVDVNLSEETSSGKDIINRIKDIINRIDDLEKRIRALEKINLLKNEIAETFKEQCESVIYKISTEKRNDRDYKK